MADSAAQQKNLLDSFSAGFWGACGKVLGKVLIAIGLIFNPLLLGCLFSPKRYVVPVTAAKIIFGELIFIWAGIVFRKSRQFSSIVLSIAALSVTLLMAEAFCRFAENRAALREVRKYEGMLTSPSSTLSYTLTKDATVVDIATFDGKEMVNVTYHTDKFGRRKTFLSPTGSHSRYLLFLGCSFTFGELVNDWETMPSRVAELSPHSRVYNYGVLGWGPQQMMTKMIETDFSKEIKESDGSLVLTLIDHHIDRAVGTADYLSQGGGDFPYFYLDTNGNLVRGGTFSKNKPESWKSLLSRFLSSFKLLEPFRDSIHEEFSEADFELFVRMIVETKMAYERKFGNQNFYVLVYPRCVAISRMIAPRLRQAGVAVLDYTDLFPPLKVDQTDPFTLGFNPHPNPQAYKIVAAQLARDLHL